MGRMKDLGIDIASEVERRHRETPRLPWATVREQIKPDMFTVRSGDSLPPLSQWNEDWFARYVDPSLDMACAWNHAQSWDEHWNSDIVMVPTEEEKAQKREEIATREERVKTLRQQSATLEERLVALRKETANVQEDLVAVETELGTEERELHYSRIRSPCAERAMAAFLEGA